MKISPMQEKMMSAYQLLGQDILSISTFEHIRVLLKGMHPEVDKRLEICSKAFATIQKMQSGDIATLSAETLPEETDKQRKRKKAILFLISSLKDLRNEIKRVDAELSKINNSHANNAWHMGRIIQYAKGPFGFITIAAVVIVGIMIFSQKSAVYHNPPKPTAVPSGKQIQIINYNNKQIPLIQLFVGTGSDCDGPHYHAIGEATVTALDGTIVQDPGGCGFGKVKDVQVINVQQ